MGFIVSPSKWEVDHAKGVISGIQYQAENNGALPNTQMWRKLEQRRELNPTRFDFYHPNIGCMIERCTPYVPECPIIPPICNIVREPIADQCNSTPEPASLVSFGIAISVVAAIYLPILFYRIIRVVNKDMK